MKRLTLVTLFLTGIIVALSLILHQSNRQPFNAAASHNATKLSYPYYGEQFTAFIEESCAVNKLDAPQQFYDWMNEAYQRAYPSTIEKQDKWKFLAEQKRAELKAIKEPLKRVQKEIEIGAWLHKTIKTLIPKFSLERGFEFANTIKYGERQCFLQAVLIAGLLQAMEIDAGVAMVYKNPKGQESNNGHAVTLARLSDGRDIIVDASHAEPFAEQQGIFVANARTGDYLYIEPMYDSQGAITAYIAASNGKKLTVNAVKPLDTAFLDSQFNYYRGERTPGGLFSKKITSEGLEQSAHFLRKSVQQCPKNPLAVYMLGRLYLRQQKPNEAKAKFEQAYRLYQRYGFIPQGMKEIYAQK